jgi:hypothetical protein
MLKSSTILISALLIFYFIFTIRYFFVFKKNIIITGKIKLVHLVLIWLIPFLWILLLKALTKATPGSFEIENKESQIPFSDNDRDANSASTMGF